MANADRPSGFTPITSADGSYKGGLVKVAFEDENAVATFIGDAVRLEGSANTDGDPTVDRVEDEDTDWYGVIVSFEPDRTNLERKHRLASTVRTAWVVTATNGQLFRIQDDATATLAATDVGNTFDVNAGTGNTTTGISNAEILATSAGSGNLRIEGLYKSPDNSIGANADWVVTINENSWGGDGTAS